MCLNGGPCNQLHMQGVRTPHSTRPSNPNQVKVALQVSCGAESGMSVANTRMGMFPSKHPSVFLQASRMTLNLVTSIESRPFLRSIGVCHELPLPAGNSESGEPAGGPRPSIHDLTPEPSPRRKVPTPRARCDCRSLGRIWCTFALNHDGQTRRDKRLRVLAICCRAGWTFGKRSMLNSCQCKHVSVATFFSNSGTWGWSSCKARGFLRYMGRCLYHCLRPLSWMVKGER